MAAVQQHGTLTAYTSYCDSLDTMVSSLQDGDLIKQAQAGSQVAFETLVERYRVPLLHYIAYYFGDADQRSDVLQQVLI